MSAFDIVIRCGRLLTMKDGQSDVLEDQLLGIRGSKIAAIEPWSERDSAPGWDAKTFFDARKQLVMPGLVNGHTHLPMSLLRGLADDLPFQEWLHQYILPLEGRIVNEEFVRLGAELSAVECVMSGVTTVCDMYYFEDAIADAVDRTGIRALLGESFADFPAPDDKQQRGNNLAILERMVERYGRHERIRPAVAPHAPYTCSDATLRKAADFAAKHDLALTIHVSETKLELENSFKEHGKSPVQRLEDLGFMERHAIFAHCVHLSEGDIDILVKRGVGVIHNPESNMKLGSGAAPVKRLLQRGAAVGIGTDGPASNNNLSIFEEMDTAAKLQKLVNEDNTALTARQALVMATLGGARALNLHKEIGSLEVGKFADIITLDFELPHMQPVHDVASQLVYSANGSEVRTVICHGRVLMQDRKPTLQDTYGIFERIKQYRSRAQF